MRARPLTEAAVAALGIDASNGANAVARASVSASDLGRAPPVKSSAETLYRDRLLPGLDLVLSADAGASARAAAERIQREFLDPLADKLLVLAVSHRRSASPVGAAVRRRATATAIHA